MEALTVVQLFCLVFSTAGAPDFYLSKSRKKLACKSANQIVEESNLADIDPSLVMALITVESNWKKTAISKAKACGLTQVIPKYTGKITKKYNCKQLQIPSNSIYVGIKTLKYWVNWHKGDIARGLCAYNAGYRCGGKRPNKHGMRYARKVLEIQGKIDALYKRNMKRLKDEND